MLQISIFSFSDYIEIALTTNICIYLYGHQKICLLLKWKYSVWLKLNDRNYIKVRDSNEMCYNSPELRLDLV